jgi:[acyl-carrier-protein] S-malonyltransferase
MLTPWLELPGAADKLRSWSHLVGVDLLGAGTTWSDEDIRDTSVAQPLLTAAALLSGRALLGDRAPDVVCGHSIGELPALALAGVIRDEDALALAAVRGRAMAAATRRGSTGMVAVLGGDANAVLAAAEAHGLELATVNVDGQLVLGGPADALDALVSAPPAGARVRRLDVAGAFHTSAMEPAVRDVAAALQALTPQPPQATVVANRDGAVVRDGREALDRLLHQLTSPVRFDLCLQTLTELAVDSVVELAPGGTLTALVKRCMPATEWVALRTPDDLDRLRPPVGEQAALSWQALPSPANGVVDPLVTAGSPVSAGTPVAVVTGRGGASAVTAPSNGTVTEWLVCAGDPVREHQLLAVLG